MEICIHAEKGSVTTHWEATYANVREEPDLMVQTMDAGLYLFQLTKWSLVSIIYLKIS
jgi:hypothetical protein